jgi:hypothetical protein
MILKLGTGHTGHLQVRDEARRCPETIGLEIVFGRGEGLCVITQRSDEIPNSIPHELVIVDYGNHDIIQSECPVQPDVINLAFTRYCPLQDLALTFDPKKLYLGIGFYLEVRRIPNASAIRTSSATDFAPIFRIKLPR